MFSRESYERSKGVGSTRKIYIVPSHVGRGNRIFRAHFVDEWKLEWIIEKYAKSCMVVQAYGDTIHGQLTHSPAVQRSSQRLLLSLAPVLIGK